MVWGMNLPSGFGEFWKEGGFEGEIDGGPANGWRERLKAYYKEQTPEVQKALFDYPDDSLGNGAHNYAGFAKGKFIYEVGTCDGPESPPFTPIKDHEPPLFYDIIRGTKSLGAFITLGGGPFVVNEALKVIIERLEPDIHQFFPIEMRYRGKAYSEKYYSLVIGQYLDSFSPENSNEESWRQNGPSKYFHEETKKGISGLALSKAVFGNTHLWVERRMSFGLICWSDELQAEIGKAGLRIPKLYRMMEV